MQTLLAAGGVIRPEQVCAPCVVFTVFTIPAPLWCVCCVQSRMQIAGEAESAAPAFDEEESADTQPGSADSAGDVDMETIKESLRASGANQLHAEVMLDLPTMLSFEEKVWLATLAATTELIAAPARR